ncbi:MAG: YdcF family protein [bacterium]
MKNKIEGNYKSFLFLISILIINYFALFVFKYNLNRLPINEFKIVTIGNLLVISLFCSTILTLFFVYVKRTDSFNTHAVILIIVSILMLVPLFLIAVITKTNFPIKEGYFWGYPIRKASLGILFVVNFSIAIYFAFVVVSLIYKKGYFIYLKAFVFCTFVISLILVFAYLYTTGYTDTIDTEKIKVEKYDCGVILGAAVWKQNQPSPVLKGRIYKAFELYNKGIIDKIQVTGGKAPGELTEAETANRFLRKLGVSENDILVENKTSTTTEQIKFIRSELQEKREFEKIIIISDQFHLKRVLEICKFFNVNAEGISSGNEYKFETLIYYRIRESIALILFWLFAI